MMTSTSKKMAAVVLAVTVAMSLSACSNMSKRDRNTAIGAGAGAIGGAVLTDGSALGTLGWRSSRWYYWSLGRQII
ncbi:Osmotically inducible lipoprotein B [Klebsiella pneumoniae subsp. rhinoscleromatis]|nr:Osmotically inducible lipoprotein B [Klebsiella pneumoniae subsp. rhinoscleromatis]